MVRRQFSREFKLEAVRLVRDCGVSVVPVTLSPYPSAEGRLGLILLPP